MPLDFTSSNLCDFSRVKWLRCGTDKKHKMLVRNSLLLLLHMPSSWSYILWYVVIVDKNDLNIRGLLILYIHCRISSYLIICSFSVSSCTPLSFCCLMWCQFLIPTHFYGYVFSVPDLFWCSISAWRFLNLWLIFCYCGWSHIDNLKIYTSQKQFMPKTRSFLSAYSPGYCRPRPKNCCCK